MNIIWLPLKLITSSLQTISVKNRTSPWRLFCVISYSLKYQEKQNLLDFLQFPVGYGNETMTVKPWEHSQSTKSRGLIGLT